MWNSFLHRILLRLPIFVSIFFILTLAGIFGMSNVYAADNPFETTLETTYLVEQSGQTKITHLFVITNKTPTTFLKQYGLKLHGTTIENIVAKSNNKDVAAEVKKGATQTDITLNFPDQVVGEGKRRTFSISYTTSDIADVANKVLEVHIPPFAESEEYKNHTVILKTPLQFAKAVRTSPQASNVTVDPQGIVTTFNQPAKTAISAFFGKEQYYNVTLRYNLENKTSSTGLAQIALPPDTSFQKVHIFSLDPPTDDIKIDNDGNWIATYSLPPQTEQAVYLTAAIKVTLEPLKQVPIIQPRVDYLANAKYWETNNQTIKEKAQQLQTPEEIYNHVVESLTYSYAAINENTSVTRLGAAEAFAQPTAAVCQEFTDAFVAIARARGIHSRRLTGYAYTENHTLRPLSLTTDVLHAWPEFYDSTTSYWRPIDPTWGKTTGGIDYFHSFDLNHIVFAINGSSSTTPIAAGSYKTDLGNTKDVEVKFVNEFPHVDPDFIVELRPDKIIGLRLPGQFTLALTNKTGQAWYDISIGLDTQDKPVSTHLNGAEKLAILPNQTVHVPLQVVTHGYTSFTRLPLKITVRDTEQKILYETTTELTAGPSYTRAFKDQNLVIGLGVGLAIVACGTGSILVFRRGRKSSVRRQSQKPQTKSDVVLVPQETPITNPPVSTDSPPAQVQNPQK